MSARVRVRAPAKVNLFLEVLARRPDGFHEIESVLLAIDLADELELVRVSRASGAPVRIALCGLPGEDVPADRRNLAWRAAELALERARELGLAGEEDALAIELDKRVPSGAGLGGGSSDAAAALVGAAALLGLDPEDAVLARGLAALGSDCAFFLAARRTGAALCTGRGERVRELPAARGARCLALLSPACTVPTAGVYRALRVPAAPHRLAPRERDLAPWWEAPLDEARARLLARLEEPALALHPELRAWRALLDEVRGEHFRLSGSGSSFFGIYDDAEAANAFLEELTVRAKARDLGLRGRWVVHPSGAGARLVPAE